MADDWQQLEGDNKNLFDEFLQDHVMQDLLETSSSAKETRYDFSELAPAETAPSGSNEIPFDDLAELMDDPDMRAILEMSPLDGVTPETSTHPLSRTMGQLENDENSGKSVPCRQIESDQCQNYQEELDLQQPGGTLLAGFLNSTTPPLGATDYADGFVGTGVLIPSAHGIPDSEPGLMDIDDAFRLPDLPGSPLSDYDPGTLEMAIPPKATQKQSAQVFGPPQQKKLPSRRKGVIRQTPGFPSSAEPLPPNLTLEEIASSWPNHLKDENLERFLEAGWGGKKIWNLMPEAAKELGPKQQGWNKITKRLIYARRRMKLEGGGSVGVGLTTEAIWNNLTDENSTGPAQQCLAVDTPQTEPTSMPSPATLHVMHALGTVVYGSPFAEPVQSITSSESDRSASEGPLAGLRRAFEAVLDEQALIISQILSYRDADWLLIPLEASISRVNDVWMNNAQEHEARFIRETLVDAGDILFDQTNHTGMLKRLGELVSRAVLASNPPRLATNADEEEAFQEQHHVFVLENELSILEGWTKSWKEQLERIAIDFTCNLPDEKAPSCIGYEGLDDQLFEKMSPHTPALPGFEQRTSLTEVATSTYDEQVLMQQPVHNHLQTEVAVDDSQNPVGGTGTTNPPRRGRKRIRMFPNAPSREVVLTEQDLADPDNILENFPEHLTLHHVAGRFLGPMGSKAGSYPTKNMVMKLRGHHNAKHGSDLNHPDRDRGLYDWIMSQKDGARRGRRARYASPQQTQESAIPHACSGQDVSDHGTLYEEEQIDAGDIDLETTYGEQHQQNSDDWFDYFVRTDDADAHEADLSTLSQASAEQAAQVVGHDPQYSTDLAALLDPRLFE